LNRSAYRLQPMKDIHLKSAPEEVWSSLPRQGDIRFVWLFGAVAVFIVLIACINFINLSTAKSASRAKEVGLRKTVGSYRGNIISQFLIESLIYSVISFVFGIVFAWVILPNFNDLTGKLIVFPWTKVWFAPCMIAAAIVIGFFAGLYPSFYLSSFKPVEVLKGSFARSNKNAATRSALVVFQFTTSVILIIATVVIYRQMNHILDAKLGYDKDQVLILKGTGTLGKQIQPFKEELLNISAVKSATISDYLPIWGTKRNQNGFKFEGEEKSEETNTGAQIWRVDEDYAETLGLKLVEGRFFDKNLASDSSAVVINQTMANYLKLKDPIGKRIMNWRTWTIIGVVEDFYFESMRGGIDALCMVVWNPEINTMSVKLNTSDIPGTLTAIENVWKKFAPHQPIRTAFLDDSFANMYDDVRRMGKIFTVFAAFAIFVACLGLFALSAFTVEQRSKEISIRLVLGASVRSIFQLLTMNFVKLVLISILIAAPASWYLMNEWLKGFKNQTDLGWDVFVLAGGIAVVIAIGTISYQSIRAGLAKPVNNLRSE
jgi:putative ABC transport system permease protein